MLGRDHAGVEIFILNMLHRIFAKYEKKMKISIIAFENHIFVDHVKKL